MRFAALDSLYIGFSLSTLPPSLLYFLSSFPHPSLPPSLPPCFSYLLSSPSHVSFPSYRIVLTHSLTFTSYSLIRSLILLFPCLIFSPTLTSSFSSLPHTPTSPPHTPLTHSSLTIKIRPYHYTSHYPLPSLKAFHSPQTPISPPSLLVVGLLPPSSPSFLLFYSSSFPLHLQAKIW